jgi:hypothetical protein
VKYLGQTLIKTDACFFIFTFDKISVEKSWYKTIFLLKYFFAIFADQASLQIIFCALGNKYLYKYFVDLFLSAPIHQTKIKFFFLIE